MLRTHEEKGISIAWHNVILQTYFACYAGGLVVALGGGLIGRKERVTVFNLRALTCTVGVSLPLNGVHLEQWDSFLQQAPGEMINMMVQFHRSFAPGD